jgi:TolA-binding protein
VSAFDSSDYARAAARFGVFVSQHPGDPRAEDAAYLRTLALQRAGNDAAL